MIGSFNEYQKEAMKTATPKVLDNLLVYGVLELIDEAGEYMIANAGERRAEHGDRAWAMAAVATAINVSLDDLYDECWRSERPSKIKRMFLDYSDLCGVAKKVLRDNNGCIQDRKRDLAEETLRRVFANWVSECTKMDWNMFELLQENLDKLADRKVRNVIQGDGDYR